MLTKHVNGAFGPLEVILHSPTSGQVRSGEQPLLVNGVEVTVTAYISEDTNPHSPTHGGVKIEYLSIKKPSDSTYKWEASWKMREKITVQVLAIWQHVLADPAMLAQVKVDKAAVESARAQSAVEAAQKVLDEALAHRVETYTAWVEATREQDEVLAQQEVSA